MSLEGQINNSETELDIKEKVSDNFNEAKKIFEYYKKEYGEESKEFQKISKEYNDLYLKTVEAIKSENKITKVELKNLQKEFEDVDNLETFEDNLDRYYDETLNDISNTIDSITDSVRETKKEHIKVIAESLLEKGNIPDNETIISVLNKIQFVVTGEEDKKISILKEKLKNSAEGNPVLQLEASNIIGEFTGLTGFSVFNKTQELIVSKIFKGKEGFNKQYLMGYNNEKGNFIIRIESFKFDIESKPLSEWNSLALANYFELLKSKGELTIENLQNPKIFGKEKLVELGKYWKENPKEAIARNLLKEKWLEEEKEDNSFTLHPYEKSEVSESSTDMIEKIEDFASLFDDITGNFDDIINQLNPALTQNNTSENLESALTILSNEPQKIKELNEVGFEKYGNGRCPQSNDATELLRISLSLELEGELSLLYKSLEGFKTNEGLDAFEYLKERLGSKDQCDPHALINMLQNDIKGPNEEKLNIESIKTIKDQLANIKDKTSKKNIVSDLSSLLSLSKEGEEISTHEFKVKLQNKYGIDINDFNSNTDGAIKRKIKENSKIPKELKEELIIILIQYKNTQNNVDTLKNADKDTIKMMLKFKKDIFEKLHLSRTSIYAIKEMFIESPETFEIFKKVGVQNPDELNIILSNYNSYKKLLNKLEKLKNNGGIKDEISKNSYELFKSIESYVKDVEILQEENKYNLSESISSFKGYSETNNSDYINNKTENKEEINNIIKLSKPNNNYFIPTNENYLPTDGGYILKGKNGEPIKGLIISEEEKNLTIGNPEATENLLNFYTFFKKLNLEGVWKYRKELITAIGDVNINPDDADSIKTEELRKFGNSLLTFIANIENKGNKQKINLNNIDSVNHRLREFSGANTGISDSKTFNIQGEDKFTSYLRKEGIIGGAYFKINKFRENI